MNLETLGSSRDDKAQTAFDGLSKKIPSQRYALAYFCDAQIDWPIAAVPTCVGPVRPPRYETTYYTDYMIRYQARIYNVFGDQAKDAAE